MSVSRKVTTRKIVVGRYVAKSEVLRGKRMPELRHDKTLLPTTTAVRVCQRDKGKDTFSDARKLSRQLVSRPYHAGWYYLDIMLKL